MEKKTLMEKEEIQLLREQFLSPGELFLLKFMSEFDRRKNLQWQEAGIWSSMSQFSYS
jgi:hypothetical protein